MRGSRLNEPNILVEQMGALQSVSGSQFALAPLHLRALDFLDGEEYGQPFTTYCRPLVARLIVSSVAVARGDISDRCGRFLATLIGVRHHLSVKHVALRIKLKFDDLK